MAIAAIGPRIRRLRGSRRRPRCTLRPERRRRLLDPAGLRVGDRTGADRRGHDGAALVDQQRLGVGRALVDGEDVRAPSSASRAAMTSRTAAAMPVGVRPKCSSRNSAEPVGTKPGKPSMRMGTGAMVASDFGHRAAEAAAHRVLLDGDDRAGLGGRADRLDVERRDRRHVDDAGRRCPSAGKQRRPRRARGAPSRRWR